MSKLTIFKVHAMRQDLSWGSSPSKLLVLLPVGLILTVATAWAALVSPNRSGVSTDFGGLRVAWLDSTEWTISWDDEAHNIKLMTRTGQDEDWICPRLERKKKQPFCRRFPARFLDACQKEDRLQIVLTNGEIYRVDHALLGFDGHFGPKHHPNPPLSLQEAWIPTATCLREPGLAPVFAVDRSGSLLHFNGRDWRQVRHIPAIPGVFESKE